MNLYAVLSEELHDSGGGRDPPEDYAIFRYVVARGRSQAMWQAWTRTEKLVRADVRDMPRMHARIVERDVPGPVRVVPETELPKERRDHYWGLLPETFGEFKEAT